MDNISDKTIEAIIAILKKGNTVEIKNVQGHIQVIEIIRKKINIE